MASRRIFSIRPTYGAMNAANAAIRRNMVPTMRFASSPVVPKNVRIPAKSEMHNEDFRFVDKNIPGYALSVWWPVGAPAASWLGVTGAVFLAYAAVFHIGRPAHIILALAAFCFIKMMMM